ncbi:hypothetical protein Dda_5887 [Drechslerella dactyloides]|uniref:Translation initiation factor eIF2B subunit alpha n=1 Tax=Drechslerella dactyloides TaxID=74499 RepID=A0AAD6IV89_DREDA|nr:hypothetical protein Dda_5887 [Drechslerella dactyloides]
MEVSLIGPLSEAAHALYERVEEYKDLDGSIIALVKQMEALHQSIEALQETARMRRLNRSFHQPFNNDRDPTEHQLGALLKNIDGTHKEVRAFFESDEISLKSRSQSTIKRFFRQNTVQTKLRKFRQQYQALANTVSDISNALVSHTIQESINNPQSDNRLTVQADARGERSRSRDQTYMLASPRIETAVLEEQLQKEAQNTHTESQMWLFREFENGFQHQWVDPGSFQIWYLLGKVLLWVGKHARIGSFTQLLPAAMSSPVIDVPPKLVIPEKAEAIPPLVEPLADPEPGVVRVTNGEFDIREAYLNYLRNDPELTMPVAAIKSLVDLVEKVEAQTTSEFLDLLNKGIIALKDSIRNPISLSAGCDLFLRFIVRYLRHSQTLPRLVNHLKQSYKLFDLRAKDSRNKIAKLGPSFITDGSTVMTISYSRVVLAMMMEALKKHIRFKVIVTEGAGGTRLASVLRSKGVPVAVIPEGAVGYAMDHVDMVLIGAEGVVENGGIINVLGTFQMATLARAAGKDVFAVCETHKFVRLYPINAYDLPVTQSVVNFSTDDTPAKSPTDEDTVEKSERIGNDRFVDFTPPTLLTAIITEAGVLTPSSVSEELLKIWF